jgi:opacity protein-like surface antigen
LKPNAIPDERKPVTRFRPLLFLFLSALAISPELAGEDRISTSFQSNELGYAKGTREIEVFGGAFSSVNDATRKRPQVIFALADVREGWMLNDVRSGFFFGNEEFLMDAFAGPIFKGPGNVMGGVTFILRHNFVTGTGGFLVPYYQMGVGGLCSDAANADHVQFGIGSTFEFNLQATVGARWRVNPSWSINTELGYRHISNGGLDSRNGGVDAVGAFFGVGRMF